MPILQPTPANIEYAVYLLRAGQCIGLPTETVYGLAADGLNAEAVARIFEIKKRPRFNPLILHVVQDYPIEKLAQPNDHALHLIEAFWPGPLTILLPKERIVPDLVTAGLETVALRSPKHPVAQTILKLFNGPLAAPSANRFGRISPTDAAAVQEELGESVPAILDGGPCSVGIESTIINLSDPQPQIMRQGAISAEEIESVLKTKCSHTQSEKIVAPGMLTSHYAPQTSLYLSDHSLEDETEWKDHYAYLFWSQPKHPTPPLVRILTSSGRTTEAAANLFRMLRELDQLKPKAIVCDKIPQIDSLSQAIQDRLMRAAAASI